MGILRKDYILERWVYYATERRKRPMEFMKKHILNNKTCVFCPGNEHLTPKEIGRIKHKNTWKIRWFPNKFPAVELKGTAKIKATKYLSQGNTYGIHEIIAETRDHNKQLADLSVQTIKEIFDVYIARIRALSKLKNIKYVTVFKNHGADAGTSLVHSHTQVAAISLLPQELIIKLKAAKKYKKCPYCDIIKLESKSKRKISENESVIVFAPFASRFNFEAWIFPKRHVKNITSMNDNELYDMASILKKILIKLKKLNASYNFFLHYAPVGYDLHFHIEVTPRFQNFGGFELSTGSIINSILPEHAANFYRQR